MFIRPWTGLGNWVKRVTDIQQEGVVRRAPCVCVCVCLCVCVCVCLRVCVAGYGTYFCTSSAPPSAVLSFAACASKLHNAPHLPATPSAALAAVTTCAFLYVCTLYQRAIWVLCMGRSRSPAPPGHTASCKGALVCRSRACGGLGPMDQTRFETVTGRARSPAAAAAAGAAAAAVVVVVIGEKGRIMLRTIVGCGGGGGGSAREREVSVPHAAA